MGGVLLAGAAFGVYQSVSALFTGEIMNAFSRRSSTLHARSNPIRFVGSLLGWAFWAFWLGVSAVLTLGELPRPLYALAASYAGPVVSIALLIRARPVERTSEPPRAEGYRALAAVPDETEVRRRARLRIDIAAAPAVLAFAAPVLWLATGYRPRDPHAWTAAALAVVPAAIAMVIRARYRRRVR
jgi:hypothetical protein